MSDNEILSWNMYLARITKYNVETDKETIIFDGTWTLPVRMHVPRLRTRFITR